MTAQKICSDNGIDGLPAFCSGSYYALEDKIVKKVTDKAAHVYLPISWEGKHVRIILMDDIETP